jgi:hypothetical protein
MSTVGTRVSPERLKCLLDGHTEAFPNICARVWPTNRSASLSAPGGAEQAERTQNDARGAHRGRMPGGEAALEPRGNKVWTLLVAAWTSATEIGWPVT